MRVAFAAVLALTLTACGADRPQTSAAPAPTAAVSVKPPTPNYVMKDGMKYGYPAAISEDARRAGQVAEQLIMAMYAGERDGRLQAHIIDGISVTALECERPCEYLKVMSYVDIDGIPPQVKVEHIAAAPGSIGRLIMDDAVNGFLRQYGTGDEKGPRYSVWVDEIKGIVRTKLPPVKTAVAPAS
ncbi:hypothetical protein NMQ14_13045 [Methyloversatilis sp. XJ19-13]|uniref:hypothetical protein n=1 Tax=Methyloversatilis sp. XJ19-13 TaxID=2963430 RepID=UPI00211C92E5|nr:hypothetical protein [Methyloversatilis sp. XJ19-13]MCQ9375179.1 hypothetical protein [Methyloversatilis sp. XJ19-13]